MNIIFGSCAEHQWAYSPTVGRFDCIVCTKKVLHGSPEFDALLMEREAKEMASAKPLNAAQEIGELVNRIVDLAPSAGLRVEISIKPYAVTDNPPEISAMADEAWTTSKQLDAIESAHRNKLWREAIFYQGMSQEKATKHVNDTIAALKAKP